MNDAAVADSTITFSAADQHFMRLALAQAQLAANHGEVPVGAVLVSATGEVLAQGYNQPIAAADPSAHAEMVALRQACQQQGNYRLPAGATLYVTLEPCTMCVGALVHGRVARVVFATTEPRAGALASKLQLMAQPFYNHVFRVEQGLLAADASAMLQQFFKLRRLNSANNSGLN